MGLTEFTLKIFLIFFPGLIIQIIVDNLTVHEKNTPFKYILHSLIYGFISYLTYFAICNLIKTDFDFFTYFNTSKQPINFMEILFVSILALPLGLLFSAIIYHKILFRFAKKFRISYKIGDKGIWTYIMTLDASKTDSQWINIVDIDNMRFYSGFIQSFSDNGEDEDEYFLRNVNVYKYKNETIGDLLFSSPGIYLNKKRENLVFEFPNMDYIEVSTETTRKKRKKCCLLLQKMLILKRRRKSNGKNRGRKITKRW